MKKALITGMGGQDGSYLAEHLLSLGYKVYGLVRSNYKFRMFLEPLFDRVTFLYGDVRDEMSLRSAMQKSWPDEIYNFAGQVFVPISWQLPEETMDVNCGGLARILKIVEGMKKDTKIYQASTSEMFGNHEGRCNDETPLAPTSPYGVSKMAAHRLVGLYRSRGLYVVGGILFNHESPRRGHEMVTMKIASAVAAWSLGSKEMLSLGNMDSRRDWGFAGEYVQAMHQMMQQDEPGDYVVGTGVSHSVEDFLKEACEVAGVSEVFMKSHIQIDQRLTRLQEIYDMRSDTTKIERVCGWKPKVGFEELVGMMVMSEIVRQGERRTLAVK